MKLDYNIIIYDDDFESIERLQDHIEKEAKKVNLNCNIDYETDNVDEDIKSRDFNKYDIVLMDLNFGTGNGSGADNKGKEYISIIREKMISLRILFYTGNSVDDLKDKEHQGIYTVERDKAFDRMSLFIHEYSSALCIKDYFRDYCSSFEDRLRNNIKNMFSTFGYEQKKNFNTIEKSRVKHLKDISTEKYNKLINQKYITPNDIVENHEVYTHYILTRSYQDTKILFDGQKPNDNLFEKYRKEILPIRNYLSHNTIRSVVDKDSNYHIDRINATLNYTEIIRLRGVLRSIDNELK